MNQSPLENFPLKHRRPISKALHICLKNAIVRMIKTGLYPDFGFAVTRDSLPRYLRLLEEKTGKKVIGAPTVYRNIPGLMRVIYNHFCLGLKVFNKDNFVREGLCDADKGFLFVHARDELDADDLVKVEKGEKYVKYFLGKKGLKYLQDLVELDFLIDDSALKPRSVLKQEIDDAELCNAKLIEANRISERVSLNRLLRIQELEKIVNKQEIAKLQNDKQLKLSDC